MPNPKGINQYSKGKSAGTFSKGTKSASSSNGQKSYATMSSLPRLKAPRGARRNVNKAR